MDYCSVKLGEYTAISMLYETNYELLLVYLTVFIYEKKTFRAISVVSL